MKEYFNKQAENYQQTGGKKRLLLPAIARAIPKAKSKNARLLDVACGTGEVYKLAQKAGYGYSGLDISKIMIDQAQKKYPQGIYTIASSMQFASRVKEKFDVIVINMLFPAFAKRVFIVDTLKESKKCLTKDGRIIIGVFHPGFDCYMRKGLFGIDYVETKFSGYFHSGKKLLIHKKFDKGIMTFEDYHWTWTDYFSCIQEARLTLNYIDECAPTGKEDKWKKEKSKFPTYLVLVCSN